MRIRSRSLLACGLLLLPSISQACRLKNVLGPVLGTREAWMLGRMTADTAFAGPGKVEWSKDSTFHRPIYGQILRVDSARGPGARAGTRVVLVPWGYGSDCVPMVWENTAVWTRPGSTGLFRATLRDSADWSNGLPTYDVFAPEFNPYNAMIGGRGSLALGGNGLPRLAAEEMFAIAAHFPSTRDSTGLKNLLVWARDNPTIAQRDPLQETLFFATYALIDIRLRSLDVPMQGTYRVVAGVGSDSLVFFLRTDRVPTTTWDDMPGRSKRPVGADITYLPPVEGYALLVDLSDQVSSIGGNGRQSYFYVPVRPDPGGPRRWVGQFQTDMPGRVYPNTAVARTFKLKGMLPVTFVVDASGAASFEHRSLLPDGRELVFRGQRIPK